jgi:hypothetical protein
MRDRYLFLDIDGVLATSATYRRWSCPHRHDWITDPGWHCEGELLDPGCVERLNGLLDASGARVVVSSTWRELMPFARLVELLRGAGLKHHPVGVTPSLSAHRPDEIEHWMDARDVEPSQVVILDDAEDMLQLRGRWVQTTIAKGLTGRHVRRAMQLWGGMP